MKSFQLLLLLFSTFAQFGFSQEMVNDSLKRVLMNSMRTTKDDTTKCNILIRLTGVQDEEEINFYNDMLGEFAKSHIKLYKPGSSQYVFYELAYSTYMYNLANSKIKTGAYLEANEILLKALELKSVKDDVESLSGILDLYGRVKYYLGELKAAIEITNRAASLFKKLKNVDREMNCLNVLGVIYSECGEYESAIKTHREVYHGYVEMGALGESASILMNIGSIHYTLKNYDSAFFYCERSLVIMKRIKHIKGLAEGYNNLGLLYMNQSNLVKAEQYIDSSLMINESIQNRHSMASNYKNLASVYLRMKQFDKAETFALKAIKIAKENGMKKMLIGTSQILYRLYKKQSKYQQALEYYTLLIQTNDTLHAQENKKASLKSQMKYEYEKKASADSVKAAEERKVVDAQLKQEKTQRFALYGGLGLVGIFALFMVNRFRVTNKQKKLIEDQKRLVEHQKHLVEEKQTEILDSIKYARRIQSALITSEFYISQSLKRIRTQ